MKVREENVINFFTKLLNAAIIFKSSIKLCKALNVSTLFVAIKLKIKLKIYLDSSN